MLKANKRTLVITGIITVLPILAGLILWNRLPDVMATHFGMNGEANGFSSKAFAVFGIPLFCLAIQWLCAFITSQDPRRQNISPKLFSLVLWTIPMVSLFCAVTIYPFNLGISMNPSTAGLVLVSIMFIVIGNYLPKTRQNYTIGIKIPWTLADEDTWNRTHRMAGFLWTAGGIVMLLLTICGAGRFEWLFVFILCMVLIPCIYSFFLHTRQSKGTD